MIALFSGVVFSQAVERFNANVGYSGLNHAVTHEVCEDNSHHLLLWKHTNLHIHTTLPTLLHALMQGLFAENKERLINGALQALLLKEGDQTVLPNEELEAQFHALRRLVASKAGYEAFTSLPK